MKWRNVFGHRCGLRAAWHRCLPVYIASVLEGVDLRRWAGIWLTVMRAPSFTDHNPPILQHRGILLQRLSSPSTYANCVRLCHSDFIFFLSECSCKKNPFMWPGPPVSKPRFCSLSGLTVVNVHQSKQWSNRGNLPFVSAIAVWLLFSGLMGKKLCLGWVWPMTAELFVYHVCIMPQVLQPWLYQMVAPTHKLKPFGWYASVLVWRERER